MTIGRKGQVAGFGWGIALQTTGNLQTDARLKATRIEFPEPTCATEFFRPMWSYYGPIGQSKEKWITPN